MNYYIVNLERILALGDKIKAVEKEQYETGLEIVEKLGRLKRTAGRVGRMENSFPALVDRIDAIEKKQAERFPHLIERLDRIEQSIVALVNRLNSLEKDTHTHTIYAGTAVPVTKDSAEGGSW